MNKRRAERPPPVVDFDVIIIGGGPSGLSAALLLGRCLRNVLVVDEGRPRNKSSPAMHGFLSRDGMPPKEFLKICQEQLLPYETVRQIQCTAERVTKVEGGFRTFSSEGLEWTSKAVLLTTGLIDRLPSILGIERFYGTSVHHCPYCDGWENRGKRLCVLGNDQDAADLAIELRLWSLDVSLVLNGGTAVMKMAEVTQSGVKVIAEPVERLVGAEKTLQLLVLHDGRQVPCDALFFSPAQAQHSRIAEELGCDVDKGSVCCDSDGCTEVTGLFVAGNATKGIQMVIVAAAEGVQAAAAINRWLLDNPSRSTGG